jgi:hypothetical protein
MSLSIANNTRSCSVLVDYPSDVAKEGPSPFRREESNVGQLRRETGHFARTTEVNGMTRRSCGMRPWEQSKYKAHILHGRAMLIKRVNTVPLLNVIVSLLRQIRKQCWHMLYSGVLAVTKNEEFV